jgi:SnoaL-like domain
VSARGVGIGLILVLAAGVFFARGWWDGPESQIDRVLDGIARRLAHDKPISGLGAASAAAGLQEYFAPDVVVELGPPFGPLTGRDAVVAAAARVISGTPGLDVDFVDRTIVLQPSVGGTATTQKDWAEVTCNVTSVTQDRAGQQTRDAREVNLTMHIVEGRWVVARAKALSVLEPVQ